MDLLPKHVAVIMDGNGRWAERRHLPRVFGHRAGIKAVQRTIQCALDQHIPALTLFAFGLDNWLRPEQEISHLMKLFVQAIEENLKMLIEKEVRVRFIGQRNNLAAYLLQKIEDTESLCATNTRLTLTIAFNYSGQWDIVQAVQQIAQRVQSQELAIADINENALQQYLALADMPAPDLLIRTSGEQRISNFMLWQCAYTELYFSDVLWPDFSATDFNAALQFFGSRERRFGKTAAQLVG